MNDNTSHKQHWLNLINTDRVDHSDKQRQLFSLAAMIAIALVLVSCLIVLNYQLYTPLLTTMLTLVNVILIGCAIYYLKTNNLQIASVVAVGGVFILCICLGYTGGKENTALYWLMFYPVVTFAVLGVKQGSWLSLTLLVCCIGLIYGPDVGQAQYGAVEKTRFIASYSLVSIFSYIGEYFRYKSHLTITDITLEQTQDAYTDPSTGVANRRYITKHFLPQADAHPQQYVPFTILLLDLDNFKQLNDTFGHSVGDSVLVEFARLLEAQFPANAIKARYGGEEFMVILPQVSLAKALKMANVFRAQVAKQRLFIADGPHCMPTCSIGVAQVNNTSEYQHGLNQADVELYNAKAAGRNTVMPTAVH
jgi:two-component system, cell cycle response regulator